MSKVCSVCGKGKISGNQVSHSNKHNKRTWSANIRNVKKSKKKPSSFQHFQQLPLVHSLKPRKYVRNVWPSVRVN